MSRIGKQEIQIPKGVQVTKSGNTLSVKGPKGTFNVPSNQVEVFKQNGYTQL